MIRIESTSAESAPPPQWLVAQRWERLLFAHWPVDPDELRAVLPHRVEPDVRDGTAWLAIVAFVMVGTRAAGPPWWPVLAPIPELNVRTYVRVNDVPAVWFLSLDASSTFFATVGRTLYGMRYHVAEMQATEVGGRMHYRSLRPGATFEATYAPAGPIAKTEEGSLEHFLVERYRLFSERRGRLITAVVAHEPWPLQPAKARIDVNELAPPGLEFSGEPILHFCRSVSAVISAPSPAGSVSSDATRPADLRAARRVRPRRSAGSSGRTRMPADAA
jgi:uncharacterized protein YqjF (DUF2071 family)